MIIPMEDAKKFLRLDSSEEDELLQTLIITSESLCQSIIRFDLDEVDPIPEIIKTAILYSVTYLYENRENADYKELTQTLKYLLFGVREEMF